MNKFKNVANFLFEIGTLRKVPRAHAFTLLTSDITDNISSHKFRVSWIGWFLAQMEKADTGKVVMMCLLHDIPEARSNDQNWVHKKYVKVFENEIIEEQLKNLPGKAKLKRLFNEYETRKSIEAKLAKDADLIDQILLLKEYAHTGNKEAESWLHFEDFENNCQQYLGLHSKSAKKLAKQIAKSEVSDWWKEEKKWTKDRR
jgi:putative hydrolase of HD superfamily